MTAVGGGANVLHNTTGWSVTLLAGQLQLRAG